MKLKIIIGAVIVAALSVFGFFVLTRNGIFETHTDNNGRNANVGLEYTFETFKKEDESLGGFTGFQVVVYRNGNFLKAFPIDGINLDVSSYKLSPDKKYVSFKASAAEGGCLTTHTLMVIDLENLAFVALPEAVTEPVEPVSESPLYMINDIQWIDSGKLQVRVQYGAKEDDGDEPCGLYAPKIKTYAF